MQINIKVKIKPGSISKINEAICDGFDPIENYLGLKSSLDQNLNMMKNGSVKEYNKYEEVLFDWFQARSSTYKKRFERIAVITKLKIEFIKEIIRFVENRKRYNFSDINETRSDLIMKKDSFIKFNKSLLENPKFTPIDKIESLVKGDTAPGASYDYLYSIGPKQQMQSARDARQKKLKELEDYYTSITKRDIIKSTWLAELKELDCVIKKAMSSSKGWLYGESKAKLV